MLKTTITTEVVVTDEEVQETTRALKEIGTVQTSVHNIAQVAGLTDYRTRCTLKAMEEAGLITKEATISNNVHYSRYVYKVKKEV